MNSEEIAILLPYAFIMLLIWAIYAVLRNQRTQSNKAQLDEAQATGLTEPASLHPMVDLARCIGCGSCVEACPEKRVLGLINGKAALINPTSCIGHGACQLACPTHGITLVFGTEKRGVDIPLVKPNFETNVPRIFIAGELGGMGLIRNAVNQGVQAVDSIKSFKNSGPNNKLDLIIVGAGPAGIAAALAAKAHKLSYLVLEQDSLGGTIAHYPRGKLVMTAPATLPLVGEMPFTETTKEALMVYWQQITHDQQLNIHFNEHVEDVKKEADDFTIKTPLGEHHCHNVLLAIGRRGTPRKMGVPGEELSKVIYHLIDPQQFQNQHVLVVGGGDSALEAACSIAEENGTTVTLSYRSDAFSRAKQKNRERVSENEKQGSLRVIFNSSVTEVTTTEVKIKQHEQLITIRNDAVVVCTGGILPTPFLKNIGIQVETKFGTA